MHNPHVSREATILDVPFVRQRHSWDCSIACIAMLLSYGLRQIAPADRSHQPSLSDPHGVAPASAVPGPSHCYDAVRTEQRRVSSSVAPLWTVDVALLLDSSRLALLRSAAREGELPVLDTISKISMFSAYLGVNPQHSATPFYEDTYEEDKIAVQQSFRVAGERGLECVLHILTEEEMAERLVGGRCAFICLVDATKFCCAISRACTSAVSAAVSACSCALQVLGTCCYRCGCSISEEVMPFAGHFVVLVGYDPATDLFVVRNPAALVESMCSCTMAALRNARSSPGTDYDTICVSFSC